MTEYLLLGAGWLLLSLPLSVFIGKCISVGQAGETERHAADADLRDGAEVPTVPAQRRPAARTTVRA